MLAIEFLGKAKIDPERPYLFEPVHLQWTNSTTKTIDFTNVEGKDVKPHIMTSYLDEAHKTLKTLRKTILTVPVESIVDVQAAIDRIEQYVETEVNRPKPKKKIYSPPIKVEGRKRMGPGGRPKLSKEKRDVIIAFLRDGEALWEISRKMKVSRTTVRNILTELESAGEVLKCGCGRLFGHRGRCEWRIRRLREKYQLMPTGT